MRYLIWLGALAIVLPVYAASQPSPRIERTHAILRSWQSAIEQLHHAHSSEVTTLAQAEPFLQSTRDHLRQIPSDHLLYASGMAAADTVEAHYLLDELFEEGFTDQQKRNLFAASLKSALDPIFYLFSYNPDQWQDLVQRLPEIKDSTVYHDIALGLLSDYDAVLVGEEFRKNAVSAAFDQAYFRALANTGNSPIAAIDHAKRIAAESGLSLAASVGSWAKTIFIYEKRGRCEEARRLSEEPKQIAKRALASSEDAEIGEGFAWLVDIEVRCAGQDAFAARAAGDNATERAALVQGLAILNDGQETIVRQPLSRERVADLAELHWTFLSVLGALLASEGEVAHGLDYIWQAARLEFQQVIMSASSGDTEYSRYRIIEKWNNSESSAIVTAAAFASREPAVRELSWQAAMLSKNLSAELAYVERRTFSSGKANVVLERYRRMRNVLSTSILLIKAGYGEVGGTTYDELLPVKREYESELRTAIGKVQAHNFFVDAAEVQAALRCDDVLLDYVLFRPVDLRSMNLSHAPHYGVYVVTAKGGVQQSIDLGPADAIDAAIARYRKAYENDMTKEKPDEGALARLSGEVRQLALDPVLAKLDGSKRLYISSVSRLGLIPFEALADGTTGPIHYLIESMDIVMLASPRDLVRLHSSRQACNLTTGHCTATLIGDPQYSLRPSMATTSVTRESNVLASHADISLVWQPFERIGPTRGLINVLRHDLEDSNVSVTPMLGPDASEGALYGRDLGQLLLFATHGVFLQYARKFHLAMGVNIANGTQTITTPIGSSTTQQPREDLFGDYLYEQFEPSMYSMLALAGATDIPHVRNGQGLILRTDDGFLTAYEAELLNLESTDIVLLVGCETGLGFVPSRRGELHFGASTDTVSGFRSALQIAGAKTIVSSLWPMLAQPATQYTREFIRRWLVEGQARYEAHRAAQLDILKDARLERGSGHPLWWAGFVYQGDPGDLP